MPLTLVFSLIISTLLGWNQVKKLSLSTVYRSLTANICSPVGGCVCVCVCARVCVCVVDEAETGALTLQDGER